ncbi:hypothetical protein C8J56DRAFT_1045446 [Mycena floridula]|nr:hypothetical protein C8J56DRAFT_1045446 [Mycena floridula]
MDEYQFSGAQELFIDFYAEQRQDELLNAYLREQKDGYIGAKLVGGAHFVGWLQELYGICEEQHFEPLTDPTEDEVKVDKEIQRAFRKQIRKRLCRMTRRRL